MGPAVWILLLCAVSGILSHPTHEAEWNFKRELNGLFRKSRQSTVSTGNCWQLSASFGAVIEHCPVLLDTTVALHPEIMTQDEAEQILEWVFGFDIVNDNAARAYYTCVIAQSQTLSQLKQRLEDNNLLANVFRLVYDVLSMSVRIGKQYIPPSAILTYWNSLESVGILGLDQTRVDSLADMLAFPQYSRNYTPPAPHPGSNSAKCSHVTNAYLAVINEGLANQGASQNVLATVELMTGLDITDMCAMRNLICDLVEGASSGVQGLYDAFDNAGVFATLMKQAYPYAQAYVRLVREHFQSFIRRHASTSPPPNYGSSSHSQQYAYANQIVNQYYGVQGPTNQDRVPGEEEVLAPEVLEVATLVVEFLQELEATNLLRLPNDL